MYSILCVLLLWILCGGGTTTKSHNEFLFSGAIVSDIEDFFPLWSLWGWQGLVSGSPGRLFVCRPISCDSETGSLQPQPQAITQPCCQKAKESGKCPHPLVLLAHYLPFPWISPGVGKKRKPQFHLLKFYLRAI